MKFGTLSRTAVRDSDVVALKKRVANRKYKDYLHSIKIVKLRSYEDADISFDFPVTALVGPNGGWENYSFGSGCDPA